MTLEQQNHAWACLPKEVREEVRRLWELDELPVHPDYAPDDVAEGAAYILVELFGHHNLTSDTEPEEMLMVERKIVQEILHQIKLELGVGGCSEYQDDINMEKEDLLKYLFGDKCLPDKEEQTKPKFKVGDKVRVKEYTVNTNNSDSLAFLSGEVFTIKYVEADGYGKFVYTVIEMATPIHESYLEPYTEEKKMKTLAESLPEAQEIIDDNFWDLVNADNNNMGEKELNLCELLKGCEGETFYSIVHGSITLITPTNGGMESLAFQIGNCGPFVTYTKKGYYDSRHGDDAIPNLFPNCALYEKYPLDANRAWSEWAESRKPKRWRAKEGKQYYYLDSCITSTLEIDESAWGDNERYNMGNYFKTREEAQQAADAIRDLLLNFHIKHNEQ